MDLTLPSVLLGAAVLLILIRLIRAPLRLAARIGMNAALGFAALWAVRVLSPWTGIVLDLDLPNALVVGILGIPGLLLLILVRWAL